MTTKKARDIIQDEKAHLPAVIEAAAAMARAPDSTLDDLVACLDRGGLAAEFAALELYHRTGRPIPAERAKMRLGRAEWRRFLDAPARKVSLVR